MLAHRWIYEAGGLSLVIQVIWAWRESCGIYCVFFDTQNHNTTRKDAQIHIMCDCIVQAEWYCSRLLGGRHKRADGSDRATSQCTHVSLYAQQCLTIQYCILASANFSKSQWKFKGSHLMVCQLGEVRWCTLVVTIELTWLTDSNEWVASIALVWAEAPCRTYGHCSHLWTSLCEGRTGLRSSSMLLREQSAEILRQWQGNKVRKGLGAMTGKCWFSGQQHHAPSDIDVALPQSITHREGSNWGPYHAMAPITALHVLLYIRSVACAHSVSWRATPSGSVTCRSDRRRAFCLSTWRVRRSSETRHSLGIVGMKKNSGMECTVCMKHVYSLNPWAKPSWCKVHTCQMDFLSLGDRPPSAYGLRSELLY